MLYVGQEGIIWGGPERDNEIEPKMRYIRGHKQMMENIFNAIKKK